MISNPLRPRRHLCVEATGLGPAPLSPDDRAELAALVERIAATTPPAPGHHSRFQAELAEGLKPQIEEAEATEAPESSEENEPKEPETDKGEQPR